MAAAVQLQEPVNASAEAFEVICDQKELATQLAAVRDAVPGKVTIPILANLLLKAEGNQLTIIATDLDVTVRVSLEAKVKTPGMCTVPARKFHDYVKLLPGGEVKIDVQENHWIKIRSGRSNTKMVGISPVNFPMPPVAPKEDFGIDAATLIRLINLSGFAISDEGSRYTLMAALFVVRPDELEMVATDGHRLARCTHKVETAVFEPVRLKIPARALALVRKMFSDATTPLFIATDAKHVFIQTPSRSLVANLMTANFPQYESVIPKKHGAGIVLASEHLLTAVERSLLFSEARSGAIKMVWEPSLLKIFAAAQDIGESTEEMDILGGPESGLSIGFAGAYVREALRLIHGNFTCYMTTASAASLWEHATEDGFLFSYVLMPMRI